MPLHPLEKKKTPMKLYASQSNWDGEPEPDVLWGQGGIDALIWPKPYAEPLPDPSPTTPERNFVPCPTSSAAPLSQSQHPTEP